MKDKLLQKIANTLIINTQNLDNPGLLNGQTGIIIFLYHYARYSSQPVYNAQADEMLDEILKNVETGYMSNFEEELYEIGLGISHLIENNFVEGNADEILHDFDEKLFNKPVASNLPIFMRGLYLLARVKGREISVHFSNEITATLDICDCLYSEKTTDPIPSSLTFVNSVLFFLNYLYKMEINKARVAHILKGLINNLTQFSDVKQADYGDIITLYKFLDQIDFQWGKIGSVRKKTQENGVDHEFLNVESRVKYLWQNLLYFRSEVPDIGKVNISEYIDQKLMDLSGNDLPINNGLTGIGLGIIKEEMMKEISFEQKIWPVFF